MSQVFWIISLVNESLMSKVISFEIRLIFNQFLSIKEIKV